MQHGPLVQGRPQCPMQAVFEVKIAFPADHMREQITVERRVLGQDSVQIEHVFRGDELIKPDGAWRYFGPFASGPRMIGIGPSLSDLLKDHLTESR